MSRTVVTVVADPRPPQAGLETDALAFEALLDAALISDLQELMGGSLLVYAGPDREVRVEAASDRVKVSVDSVPSAPAAPMPAARFRQ
jgi:hypothetical protein